MLAKREILGACQTSVPSLDDALSQYKFLSHVVQKRANKHSWYVVCPYRVRATTCISKAPSSSCSQGCCVFKASAPIMQRLLSHTICSDDGSQGGGVWHLCAAAWLVTTKVAARGGGDVCYVSIALRIAAFVQGAPAAWSVSVSEVVSASGDAVLAIGDQARIIRGHFRKKSWML